jgi:hypothetical protein
VLYFCLATIVAEVILAAQFWVKWNMDRSRLVQMLAVAQGVDLLATREEAGLDRDEVSAGQVSYQEILESRAAKDLNLQLREQALDNTLDQVRSDREQLSEAQQLYDRDRAQYEAQLAELQQGAEAAGREEVRRILESVKPKQAKELLVEMLGNSELDAVVMLLREMPDSKRAKIVGEFKTPEETQKIDEVLRMIRQGAPESDLAGAAQQQLNQNPLK